MGAYEDVLAKIGQPATPNALSADYKQALAAPTTQAQYGYKAPQIQGPTPSTASKVGDVATWIFKPENDMKVTKFIGNSIINTTENLSKFSHLVTDLNPISILNPIADRRRYQDWQNSQKVNETAQAQIDNATQLYASGKLNKKQYDEIVRTNHDAMNTAGANIISHDAPTNPSQFLDTVDGAITAATLGIYALAKSGAIDASKLALKGTSEFVMNRMAAADALASTKGISQGMAANITRAAAPKFSEKLAMTAEQAIYNTPMLARNYDRILREIGTSANAKGFAKNVLVQLAFVAPMRRENIRMTADMVNNFRDGNYFIDGTKIGAVPEAVLLAGMALEGGPVGFLTKNFAKLGKVTKTAMYGETAFIDDLNKELVKSGMQGDLITGINAYLDRAPASIRDNAKIILKQIVGTNLQRGASSKVAYSVAQHITQTLAESGSDISKVSADKIVENMMVHADMQNLLQEFNRTGMNVVAAKYDVATQKILQKSISKALGKEFQATKALATLELRMARRKEIAKAVIEAEIAKNPYWAQNQDVVEAMYRQIDNAKSVKAIVGAPSAFAAGYKAKGIPAAITKKLKANGYLPVVTESQSYVPQLSRDAARTVELKSKVVPVNDKLFEQAAISSPVFRSLGSALTKAGLGLDESAAVAYRMVRDNASEAIQKVTGYNGRKVLNAMQQWAETGTDSRLADLVPGNWSNIGKRLTTDMRMMSNRQIKEALSNSGMKITNEQATAIRKAVIQAHMSVPLQTMGLADKLVAGAYKHVPFYKLYAKAQGAFRYTYNPFFNVQEQVETELLGQAITPGKQPYLAGFGALYPGGRAKLDGVVKQLETAGFFNNSAVVSNDINKSLMATRFGEGAQDVYLGRVSAHITQGQKRSIAGAVAKIADKMGMSVEDALATNGAMIEDIIRPIVQYPTHGALNSNLAKALNIAVFPSRYNVKVASIAVKALGQAPPAVQFLTINKLWEMENWLKTPEGIAWQQQHNAAIQFFKWRTPVGNIQWVFDTLSAPFGKSNTSSIGDLGVIGGLPFGVISQILQDQGIITLNTPYVNPKDGAIFAKKIPESMRAKVAMAFMDLLGSTFTYPGATIGLNQLGLPSKSQLLKNAASAVSLGTKSSEWTTQNFTPADLPAMDKLKQEIWSQQYNIQHGIVPPTPTVNPKPATSPLQPGVTGGPVMTKVQALQAKQAKATSTTKKSKTTTFPSYLPQ